MLDEFDLAIDMSRNCNMLIFESGKKGVLKM